MKKTDLIKIILSVIFALYFSQISSQTIKRQSINSLGSSTLKEQLLVRQTVGQPYSTVNFNSSSLLINPGFQQTILYGFSHTEKSKSYLPLSIYPNPASTYINIDGIHHIKQGNISVIDATGRIVHIEKMNFLWNYQIDCSAWNKGIYFITLFDETEEVYYLSKVIISK